jgi:phosphoribosylformylglycinamidine cyclo-ligase
MQPLVSDNLVKGMAHITGGGITENLPRTLPQGCSARVDRGAWSVPPLFAFLQKRGAIGTDEMFRTFNMGIGLVAICSAGDAENVIGRLERSGEQPVRLGQVISGDRDVRYA